MVNKDEKAQTYCVICLYDNMIDNNNINKVPEILKQRLGVRQGIACLMGRKNSSALDGCLSRDHVSIKTRVDGNCKI